MRRDRRAEHRSMGNVVGAKIVRFLSGIINLGVLVALVLCLFFGFYALWDTHQLYAAADGTQYEVYKPTEEDDRSFQDFKNVNSEVIGWLSVYGTAIDYPIVQGEDNSKYLTTAADLTFSAAGSIFLDYRNKADFSDFNNIVYGHHMAESAMFGDIGKFLDETFFYEHPYGYLYADGKAQGLEFFAMLVADAYDNYLYTAGITGEDEVKQAYLDYIDGLAMWTRPVEVGVNDRIVILYTCSADVTNGRMILVGKITDTVEDDPYAVEEEQSTGGVGADIYSFFEQWSDVPMLVWTLAILILLLLILWIGNMITRRMRRRAQKKGQGKAADENSDM